MIQLTWSSNQECQNKQNTSYENYNMCTTQTTLFEIQGAKTTNLVFIKLILLYHLLFNSLHGFNVSSVCVRVYVCQCVCVSVCVYVPVYVCAGVCVCQCMYVWCVCVHAPMCAYLYMCVCVHVYVHMCITV